MKNLKTFKQVLENVSYADSSKTFSELVNGDKIYMYNKEFPNKLGCKYDGITELTLTGNPYIFDDDEGLIPADKGYYIFKSDWFKTSSYDSVRKDWIIATSLEELVRILKYVFNFSNIDFLMQNMHRIHVSS